MGQCALILAIALVGEYLSNLITFPIPKTIIASIILFFLLEFKIVKVEYLKEIVSISRKNLAFFFMPVAVGIMTLFDSYPLIVYLKVIVVMILSTFFIMLFTGKVTDIIMGIQDKLFKKRKEDE